MTTTETLAAKITEAIAASIPETATEAEMFDRSDAMDRAESALRLAGTWLEADAEARRVTRFIFDTLSDTDETFTAASAAKYAVFGEAARDAISAADYAILTDRWFAAFEGK